MENLIIGFLAGLVIFGFLWQFVLKNKRDENKADETELKINFATKEAELKAAKEAQEKAEEELKKLKNTVDWEEITKNNQKKIVPIYLNNSSAPSGTGFIFKLNRNDNAAFAITNNHVVNNSSILQVKILNKLYSAEILSTNTKKS